MKALLFVLALFSAGYTIVYFKYFFHNAYEECGIKGIITTLAAVITSLFVVFYELCYGFVPEQSAGLDGLGGFIAIAYSLLAMFLMALLIIIIRQEVEDRKIDDRYI